MTALTIKVSQQENGFAVEICGQGGEGSTPTEQTICKGLAQLCQQALEELAITGIPKPAAEPAEPIPSDIWNEVEVNL